MKRWLGSSALVISVAIVVGYFYHSRPEDLPVLLRGQKALAVRANQLREVAVPRRVQAKDALVPGKKQDIVAPFAGRVIEIRYKTGDTVRAGAVVAIIQSNALVQRGDDLEASVGPSRNDVQAKEQQLRSAESFAAQARALYEQDLIARRDVEEAQRAADEARAQLDFVRAQLAQQEAMLAQLRSVQGSSRLLVAPFSGVVTRVLAKPGATVAEATPIITLADVLP